MDKGKEMRVQVLKDFSSPLTGNASAGRILDLPDATAIQMAEYGLVKLIRTTEATSPLADGPAKPAASSPAAQASQSSNANMSGSQESAERVESSQSTPVSGEPNGAMQSMPATAHGGGTTTQKRRGRPPKNG